MKKCKKVFSALCALLMVSTIAVPVFATGNPPLSANVEHKVNATWKAEIPAYIVPTEPTHRNNSLYEVSVIQAVLPEDMQLTVGVTYDGVVKENNNVTLPYSLFDAENQPIHSGDTILTRKPGDPNETTTASFGATLQAQAKYAGIYIGQVEFTFELVNDPLIADNLIPNGGTYYRNVKTTDLKPEGYVKGTDGPNVEKYTSGQKFPSAPQIEDVFVYGDYEYRYNEARNSWDSAWAVSDQSGWGVRALNCNKKTYSKICTSINNAPIVNLAYTFYKCNQMESAPTIPNGVTRMCATFQGCTALATSPEIPTAGWDMSNTFRECTSLTVAPAIPEGVKDMSATFSGCTSLMVAPTIPEGVKDMAASFSGCTNLTVAPLLPNSVESLGRTGNGIFENCINLKSYVDSTDPDGDFSNYKLPSNLKNMYNAFRNCEKLSIAPKIPTGVEYLDGAYCGCINLVIAPTIPNGVKSMDKTFYGCSSLINAPEIPNSVENMNYTYMNCTSLLTVQPIPSHVKTMMYTFCCCTKLTGDVIINANPTSFNGCFSATQKTITLKGTSTMLGQLSATASNGNVTVA